ncbi:MAG TPA: hypothetical protein VMA74_05445 [Dyella sp.]|uniref:hypothetical protein n=1 Tax=Dyella sp. TaxID=1869338 RepID=UPI002C2381D2|nr:hypothetical protein [Dyella sp.]HUB89159.1 hypothetical protein [Dyella sp.]
MSDFLQEKRASRLADFGFRESVDVFHQRPCRTCHLTPGAALYRSPSGVALRRTQETFAKIEVA